MLKRKSRTKASFPHLQLSLFEGSLPRKLRFHIFHSHFLREVPDFDGRLSLFEGHESFVFTSSTVTFLKEVLHESFVLTSSSRTKASFSHLPLPEFAGSLARNAFLRDSGQIHAVFAGQNVSQKEDGEACPGDGCETVSAMFGSWSDRPLIGTASSGFIFTL